jgi:glycosyltransferase involved in cell wall biosynthesis
MVSYLEYYLYMASAIRVSSQPLAESLARFHPASKDKIFILENLIDVESFDNDYTKYRERPVILWAGSNTHLDDLQIFKNIYFHYKEKDANVLFVIFGYMTDDLKLELPSKLVYVPNVLKKHYEQVLSLINPDIAIIPLINNQFNKCKSSIKYLEMSMVGAASITSDVCPYSSIIDDNFDGIIVKNSGDWENWIDPCDRLIKDSVTRKRLSSEAKYNVIKNYSWNSDNPRKKAWIDFYKSIPGIAASDMR